MLAWDPTLACVCRRVGGGALGGRGSGPAVPGRWLRSMRAGGEGKPGWREAWGEFTLLARCAPHRPLPPTSYVPACPPRLPLTLPSLTIPEPWIQSRGDPAFLCLKLSEGFSFLQVEPKASPLVPGCRVSALCPRGAHATLPHLGEGPSQVSPQYMAR